MPVTIKCLLPLCLLLLLCPAQLQPVEEERQCVANPAGRVELSVDVLGTPGPQGPPGEKGEKGDIGPSNLPGVTKLSRDEVSRIISSVNTEVLGWLMNKVAELEAHLKPYIKCGIFSPHWTRVAHIDTTQGPGQCPSSLVEHISTITNKSACGRSIDEGCSSVTYPTRGSYTNICGQVRGYQYNSPNAFQGLHGTSINDPYVDGISITRGNPRQHVWTYTSWEFEAIDSIAAYVCPCGQSNPNDYSHVPSFVGRDFYCETAFTETPLENRIAWENPLWDGAGSACGTGGRCCATFGWFHRTVPSTSDHIEVRWCGDQARSNEDVLTDLVEIWVM